LSKRLLPLIPAGLSVVQVLPASERVTIVTRPHSATAACPDCGTISQRVHSHYERTLVDLLSQGRPVRLRVQARRFRCLHRTCPQQTFAECLVSVASAAARRTERLGGLQRHLGLALGGEAGARLAERLAIHRGFAGCPATVRAWAGRRRRREPAVARGHHGMTWHLPSASQVACLLMADTDALATPERAFVDRLRAEAPRLADAVAKQLNRLLRSESEESLDRLLADVAGTLLAEFTANLRRDLAAVQAALDTPWTTSPAEGQINRIKTIKRSMYGHAGFQLLRARVLDAA
jgi:transposase